MKIYEPTARVHHGSKHKLDYFWLETRRIHVESPVSHLCFNLEGLRLLVGSDDELQLWQHLLLTNYYSGGDLSLPGPPDGRSPRFELDDMGPNSNNQEQWQCVWRTRYLRNGRGGAQLGKAG